MLKVVMFILSILPRYQSKIFKVETHAYVYVFWLIVLHAASVCKAHVHVQNKFSFFSVRCVRAYSK